LRYMSKVLGLAQKTTGFLSVFLLCVCLLSFAHAEQKPNVFGWVNNANPEMPLNLYKSPSTKSEIVGQYFNGVDARIYEAYDGWYYVDACPFTGQTGYFEADSIMIRESRATPGDPQEPPVEMTPIYAVSPGEEQIYVYMRERPNEASECKGMYIAGTLVEVRGYAKEWSSVRVGKEYGFILTKELSPTDIPPGAHNKIPTIRTAKYNFDIGTIKFYRFPADDSPYTDMNLWDTYNAGFTQFNIIADLGEWVQINHNLQSRFIKKNDMNW